MSDDLGDRMKLFELAESGKRLMAMLPAIAKLDGRSFHNFTKGLERPYDKRLSDLMIDMTEFLVKETNACCGYTQSDEITLGWYSPDFKSKIFFDGRISKITSILAALGSVYFNRKLPEYLPNEYGDKLPTFDCRVWNVPNVAEGANSFLWREHDAKKNSISMAARAYYSHKQIMHKNGKEMQEMLFSKGINWNDYPNFFKRGTFIQRTKEYTSFSPEEINNLPEKHAARQNPALKIERTIFRKLDMPPFTKVTNREDVVFFGEDPFFLRK